MRTWPFRIVVAMMLAAGAYLLLNEVVPLPMIPGWFNVLYGAIIFVFSGLSMMTLSAHQAVHGVPPWGLGRPRGVVWKSPTEFAFEPTRDPNSLSWSQRRISAVWWEPEPRERAHVYLRVDIPDGVEKAIVQKALHAALGDARHALPGRGKVRARVTHDDVAGPLSALRVALDIRGHGANDAWAERAADAFGDRLVRALAKKGVAARVAHST